MTDEEKAARAEQRAQERLVAALEVERARQREIAELDLDEESALAVAYCNRQLLDIRRRADWDFLRDTRAIHLRQGTRK